MKRRQKLAKLELEHVFDGSLGEVVAAISQFDQYPKYIPGVTKIEVLPPAAKGSSCQVRYELNLIKTFFYVLNMYQEKPNKIRWDLAESNLMKISGGSWDFQKLDQDRTKATYLLDVKFRGLVPSAVTDRVAKANLPGMMQGFQKLINDRKK